MRYDSVSNSIAYHKEFAGYNASVSGSLVQGTGTADFLYLGGNVEVTSSRWHLAIFKLSETRGAGDMTSTLSFLTYKTTGTCGNLSEDGWGNEVASQYISHLGFMNDAVDGNQLFGLTTANNFDESVGPG